MIAFDTLARYTAGEMALDEEQAFEEVLFHDRPGAEVGELLSLVDGVRALAAQGPIVPVLRPAELASLAATRAVVVATVEDGALHVAVTAETAFIVARIPSPLHGRKRIDVTFRPPVGPPYFLVRDAPFDPASGHVLICCERHVAIAAADIRVCVEDGEGGILAEARLVATAAT